MTTKIKDTPSSGLRRRTRRGPRTRKQILDVSLRLFSEHGFARTSVRDIAQAAGITDAAIYYHFDSKRDLLEALFEERGILPALNRLEHAEITEPPREALSAVALGALDVMESNRDILKVLFVEALAEDPVAMDEYGMIVNRWQRAVCRILYTYADRDIVRIPDVESTAWQLVHQVLGAFLDRLMNVDSTALAAEDIRARVRQAVDNVVEGIGLAEPRGAAAPSSGR
jgi:AcrR family transcriptional regulator